MCVIASDDFISLTKLHMCVEWNPGDKADVHVYTFFVHWFSAQLVS